MTAVLVHRFSWAVTIANTPANVINPDRIFVNVSDSPSNHAAAPMAITGDTY
jgi:hypothetical protein